MSARSLGARRSKWSDRHYVGRALLPVENNATHVGRALLPVENDLTGKSARPTTRRMAHAPSHEGPKFELLAGSHR